jgi:ubiquinone biosynthesis protein
MFLIQKGTEQMAIEGSVSAGESPWGREIGAWVLSLVPVEALVPEEHAAWRPLVHEALGFVFSRLSKQRLETKIAEQMALPRDTPTEVRLIRLISKMPGLQKLGQVLARNRRLALPLREALCQLENGMSDVTAEEMQAIIAMELGQRLETYGVEIEPAIRKEGSACAILKFTWRKAGRERQPGAFKVLKPYVPDCFAEDLSLLQKWGAFVAARERSYRFAVRDVKEMVAEVRLLLEHELDLAREQATLVEAARMYRSSIGIRVPHLIPPLCTRNITAMTAENGVKVTEAFRYSPARRSQIAAQVIEALLAVPLFSREPRAVFHADPHAGNLLYDEPNRELIVLDWALSDGLSLAMRRHVVMLAIMMLLGKPKGVSEAICGLSRPRHHGHRVPQRLIEDHVSRFFAGLPEGRSPGVLDAMTLLDELALKGVRFPSALFLFRKVLFTLDGVLQDVAGGAVRIDQAIAYEFLTRCIGSFGVFHEPLNIKDLWPLAQALLA